MEFSKPTVFVLGAGTAIVGGWIIARMYRERIRMNIANSVTSKLMDSLTTIIPGAPISPTPDVVQTMERSVSYPVADGVLEGLML